MGHIYAKDAGLWKPADKWAKDAGLWKTNTPYAKDAGIWKPLLNPLTITNHNAGALSGGSGATFNISARDISPAPTGSDRRFCIVGIGGYNGFGGSGITLSSCSLSGTPCTIIGQVGDGFQAIAALAYAEIPTGISVDPTITFSAGMSGCQATVISVTTGPDGIAIETPQTDAGNWNPTFSLSWHDGSVIVASHANRNGGSTTISGLTTGWGVDLNTSDYTRCTFGEKFEAGSGNVVITATNTTDDHASIVCAFRPAT